MVEAVWSCEMLAANQFIDVGFEVLTASGGSWLKLMVGLKYKLRISRMASMDMSIIII
jgi:hypothetical protein